METKINQFFFFFFHGIGLPIAVFESGVAKKGKLFSNILKGETFLLREITP